jgi:hypothetical protein
MAVSYVWPVGLPQVARRDYTEDFGTLVMRTPMDKGPAKQRYLGARPDQMTVSFEMTSAQVNTLRTFVGSTIRGTARFGFPHPRTGVQVEVRIIPQGDDGQMFTLTYMSPGRYIASMRLEVLP